MKHTNNFLPLSLLMLTAVTGGCTRPSSSDAAPAEESRTAVTLTRPLRGSVEQDIEMAATTVYLSKTTATAPFAAYISSARVTPGMRVRRGQTLYLLESKEQHALQSGQTVTLSAERSGIVTEVMAQAGTFAGEGQTLCVLADAGSLAFELNVPYELHRLTECGSRAVVELPDGHRYKATIDATLATMDVPSQSMRVVARAAVPFLPEGMNVKVLFRESVSDTTLLLPKEAVQSDETLSEQWVMTFRPEDSTAVRVSVKTGRSDTRHVEILHSILTPADRVILTGGYGLEDGAKVRVEKDNSSE